jgi:outer membrane protein W
MKKIAVLAVAVLMVCVCMTVPAFAGAKIGAGTSEVNVYGNIQKSESSSSDSDGKTKVDTTTISAGYGYFITDAISIGASVMGIGVDVTDSSDNKSKNTFTYLQLDGKYHFYSKGATVVPYLGASVGEAMIKSESGNESNSANGTMVMGRGGLKFFVSESTSVNLELNYARYKTTMDDITATTNATTFEIGISTYF